MSKEETPPAQPPSSGRGLLSKMARFVRHPTVNWSELDALDEQRESQYSKQMLKEMIERKRRNDFVRRREFDQLRQLRNREGVRAQPPEDLSSRTSFFPSSASSPVERADTLRKIDEIEAQMSHQWWKGKNGAPPSAGAPAASQAAASVDTTTPAALQPAAASSKGGFLQSPAAQAMSAALAGSPFVQGEHARAFAPTAPLTLPAPLDAGQPPEPPPVDDPFSPAQPDQPQPSRPIHAAPSPAPAALPSERFIHDPDLEDAAIRFASGQYPAAAAALQDILARRAAGADEADDAAREAVRNIWLCLFDLYRATGQQQPFETLAIDYAARFHRTAPLWFSLPQQLGLPLLAEEPAAPALVQRELSWNAPARLVPQSVAALQASLARAAQPWTLSWSRLNDIDPAALPLLSGLIESLADQAVELRFVGMPALQVVLQNHTPSGDRSRDPQWWRLRMALLRLMGLADEFEFVALDYCVTYEVSPPSWETPRCSFSSDADVRVPDAAPAQPGSLGDSYLSSMHSGFILSMALGDDGGAQPALIGHIEGDCSDALESLQGLQQPGKPLVVACDQLIRIDFAAGGGLLNWAAEQQAAGCQLVFRNLHRLAAVFFNVIGINEHAHIVPRSD
ncbi:STAS domain-containing protein [Melaminivora sp.]